MGNKSISFIDKLNLAIESRLLKQSNNYFSNADQFAHYISEGALLNINKIASNALSIPSGEYMVWVTDVGHTMLIPIGAKTADSEVYENKITQYEVQTPKLLQNWNRIQIVLAEAEDKPVPSNNDQSPPEANQFKPDTSGIKRIAMYRAMQNQGYDKDYGALADKVGVQTPMISRILSGDRTPSMGTASRLCSALSSDPSALFPDIFDIRSAKHKPKKVKGNRGSGMKGAAAGSRSKGKASQKWTQGNVESLISTADIIAELDSTLNTPINNTNPSTSDANSNVLKQQKDFDKQREAERQKLKPQIDKIHDDIDQLSSGLERGHESSVSSSEELANMQDQVNDIESMIDRITSAM